MFVANVAIACLLAFPLTANGFAGPCQDKQDGTLWPHLKNTSWYFECLHGIAQLLICPHLESFDVSLRKCDKYPKTSTTRTTSMSTIATTTTTTPHPLQQTSTTGSLVDHMPPQWRPPQAQPAAIQCACQDTPVPTYHRNPRSCDQYYMCYRSRPLPMFCCPGYHWLQTEQQCVPAYRSLCSNSIAHPKPPSTAPICPATGRHLYPHPSQCSQFYFCDSGQPSQQQCPPFFGWDYHQQKCVIHGQAQCISSVPWPARAQYFGLK